MKILPLLLPALAGIALAQPAPSPSWNWDLCRPETLRSPLAVNGVADPFSPASHPPARQSVVRAEGLPDAIRPLLDRLAASVRACLTEPRPLLLLDRRVFHPGDEIPLPDPAQSPTCRILLQRIDASGAHLTLWLPAEGENSPKQQEAVLRAPGFRG